jgi:hypothetical protein
VPWKKAENRLPERCWGSIGRAPRSDELYSDALYSDGDQSRGMLKLCQLAQKWSFIFSVKVAVQMGV